MIVTEEEASRLMSEFESESFQWLLFVDNLKEIRFSQIKCDSNHLEPIASVVRPGGSISPQPVAATLGEISCYYMNFGEWEGTKLR